MRTGRLRPSWSRSLRQTGWPVAHEPHRAAQAAILESIAHAMLLALHSLHCTDKCPRGRSGPWRRLTLAPTALAILLYQYDGRCGCHPRNVG